MMYELVFGPAVFFFISGGPTGNKEKYSWLPDPPPPTHTHTATEQEETASGDTEKPTTNLEVAMTCS